MAESKIASGAAHGCFLVVIPLVLGAAGLVTLWFLLILPVSRMISAQSWETVPCEIVSSGVGTHRSSKGGSTYSIDIKYSYTFRRETYTSDQYNFSGGSSIGYESKARVAARYPAGSRRECFVDPAQPQRSVLNRGPGWFLLLGLISVPFLGVAILIPFLVVRAGRMASGPGRRLSGLPKSAEEWQGDGELVLRPRSSRVGTLVSLIFATIIWNGIVSVFLVFALIPSYLEGAPDIFLTILLSPFILIGLALIASIVHRFLALFNPRPTLILSSARLYPGAQCQLSWEVSGNVHRLRSLKISLVGLEQVTYRQGTSTRTEDREVERIPILDSLDPGDMRRGRAQLQIPAGAMATFESPNNKIVWQIRVDGDIPAFPDIDDAYPIVVQPGRSDA